MCPRHRTIYRGRSRLEGRKRERGSPKDLPCETRGEEESFGIIMARMGGRLDLPYPSNAIISPEISLDGVEGR